MPFNESLQTGKDANLFINSKLFALLIRCPLNSGPTKHCPFRDYRVGGTLEEKYSFIEDLHETSRLHLLALHNRCVEMRTANYLRFNPEYSANVEKGQKSLHEKYYLVRTVLDETLNSKEVNHIGRETKYLKPVNSKNSPLPFSQGDTKLKFVSCDREESHVYLPKTSTGPEPL